MFKVRLADEFAHFQNMCFEVYEFDPIYFLSTPRLAWQTALKKDQSKIRSFSWYWYVINDRKRY